jgi:hypothetical protein
MFCLQLKKLHDYGDGFHAFLHTNNLDFFIETPDNYDHPNLGANLSFFNPYLSLSTEKLKV